jgi:hypothetical protein
MTARVHFDATTAMGHQTAPNEISGLSLTSQVDRGW